MKKFTSLCYTLLTVATLTTAMVATQVQAETATTDKKNTTISPQVQKLINQYPNLIARIHPYGRVCFDGEDCDVTITALAAAVDGQPRDGKTIYDAVCATCHGMGLAGSPKLGDTAAWSPRISKGKETLYKNAINGFNAMPAKGGADLPDEEVKNAVDYMISKAN